MCLVCLDKEVNSESECATCGKHQHEFPGPNTNNDFCEWLFSPENNGATVLAHNLRSYDSYFVLQYLYDNATLPNVIPNGSKNMAIEVPSCGIRLIDSLNFIPAALSKLPAMFGLTELAKGYFPHFFNRQENQTAVLSHLPYMHYYNPNVMSAKTGTSF